MQFIVTEEEIARLNEIIGSLAIKQFTNIHGINQKGYRLVTTKSIYSIPLFDKSSL